MFHKIKSINIMPDYKIEVTAEFFILRLIDGLFNQAKIEPGGYAISWND